jgi:hypothetical protein
LLLIFITLFLVLLLLLLFLLFFLFFFIISTIILLFVTIMLQSTITPEMATFAASMKTALLIMPLPPPTIRGTAPLIASGVSSTKHHSRKSSAANQSAANLTGTNKASSSSLPPPYPAPAAARSSSAEPIAAVKVEAATCAGPGSSNVVDSTTVGGLGALQGTDGGVAQHRGKKEDTQEVTDGQQLPDCSVAQMPCALTYDQQGVCGSGPDQPNDTASTSSAMEDTATETVVPRDSASTMEIEHHEPSKPEKPTELIGAE